MKPDRKKLMLATVVIMAAAGFLLSRTAVGTDHRTHFGMHFGSSAVPMVKLFGRT